MAMWSLPRKPGVTSRHCALPPALHENSRPPFLPHEKGGRQQHRIGLSSGLDENLRALADGPVLRQFGGAHIHEELAGLAVGLAARGGTPCPGSCGPGSERKTMRAG